jgi:hypothetical protein
VRLRGEIWNARSEVPLELGEEVRVEAVAGLTPVVARAGDATRAEPRWAPPSHGTHPAGSGTGPGVPLGGRAATTAGRNNAGRPLGALGKATPTRKRTSTPSVPDPSIRSTADPALPAALTRRRVW